MMLIVLKDNRDFLEDTNCIGNLLCHLLLEIFFYIRCFPILTLIFKAA